MRNFKYHLKSYLLSIILISILLILPSCRNIRENGLFGKKSLEKAYLWAQQDSIRVADSLKSTLVLNDFAGEAIQDSIIFTEKETLSETGIGHKYNIIAGSFANIENAKLLAKEYQSKGYQTSIIRMTVSYGKVLEMVSVKTFENYEEAFSYLKEFQSKVESSAWLYAIK